MTQNKQKYENARHHAWAGSVLLAILLAVRLILETTDTQIDDKIIIGIAIVLIAYTLVSVILTYKYSSALSESSEQKIVHVSKSEDYKIEKKKAKAEIKKKKERKLGNKMQNNNLTITGLKFVVIFYLIMVASSTSSIFILLIFGRDQLCNIAIPIIILLASLMGIYTGIGKITDGAKEFGEAHEKSTIKARNYIFYGLIFYLLVGTIGMGITSRFEFIYEIVRTIIYIPFWLVLIFLIIEISSDKVKKLLWIAFFSRLILLYISNLSFKTLPNYYTISNNVILLIAFIAALPSLLFIYCYYDTYNKIKNKS